MQSAIISLKLTVTDLGILERERANEVSDVGDRKRAPIPSVLGFVYF